jgi:hypothetical protein
VTAVLAAAAPVVTLPGEDDRPVEVTLVRPFELEAAQAGYATDAEGRDLTGGANGWRREWLVIGTDYFLGDPYFVDLSSARHPVYTAMHGAGRWMPQPVAQSLAGFLSGDC